MSMNLSEGEKLSATLFGAIVVAIIVGCLCYNRGDSERQSKQAASQARLHGILAAVAMSSDAGKVLAEDSVSTGVAPLKETEVSTSRVAGAESNELIIGKSNPDGSVTFDVPLKSMTFEGLGKNSK